ncbi:phage minor head protein [Segeticoccus rhizosphaerae]|uniref:phage minor head protein n=1 Tax=Segeticoccus rhizosphaerae TaxID=1104777 RepID=UPI0012657872|nr:phage minor head protein [Segeticoccus rhizosphaerae]
MAVNRRTLRLIAGMRLSIDTTVDKAVTDLIAAWGTAWNEVAGEWQDALADLVAASTDGKWPSRTQIRRADRARRALAVTRDSLDQLTKDFGVRVVQDLTPLADDAAQWEARLIHSQMPRGAADVAAFDRIDQRALEAVVERAAGRVTSLAKPLSRQAEAAMKSTLIRGVAVGDNPRKAASTMLRRVQGQFEGGRNRALVIARTEMLDAHRAAAYAQDQANKATVAQWQWVAQLDRRTCPSCWAKHGTTYPLIEPGPEDHQQGRCARVPVTKSWRDLGFDIDEPPSLLPDAKATFDGLPEADQVAIMGKARLGLLKAGHVGWDDLTAKRTTTGWRDSWAPRPTRDLLRLANAS